MNMSPPHESLHVERRGAYAAIQFDNPPVNALNNDIRAALARTIDDLITDASVKGVMMAAAGASFVVGADIRELEGGVKPPFLGDMMRRIEQGGKPFVAAMRGNAMGGGLEIALGCHHRLAAANTKLALPEIKLGLIPGAGGTQRTPRLIGTQAAFDMLLTGKLVDAQRALAIGLIDEIVEDVDVEERGWALLAELDGKVAERIAKPVDAAALAAAEKRVAEEPELSALPAARAMIEAVRVAGGNIDDGFARERELFFLCRESPEAVQMLRAFLAEREARRAARKSD